MRVYPQLLVLLVSLTPLRAQPVSGGGAPSQTSGLEPVRESITIVASPLGPRIDPSNAEVFRSTLFSRDDQLFQLLDAGISAGQHEGGGKSLQIRRFGFNLDHGGGNGGLRVTVDNVPQNHSTQGHGQGYLGSLKSLSPELIEDVTMINGPFAAEHGDFSGLGTVQVHMREKMPDVWTARLQGGNFGSLRGMLAWSPNVARTDALFAYEGSHSDGPFLKPLGYNRHNVNGNYTWALENDQRFGVKWNGGLNRFNSSGQIPLDEVAAGRLDRFGSLSPGDGGDIQQGRVGLYYRKNFDHGATFRADAFVERSLFDLYSNFTFFLTDPLNGDAIQQHDSRLNQGGSVHYARPHLLDGASGVLTVGGGFVASQNQVDLRHSANRDPLELFTSGHAAVTNGSGFVQESLDFGRLQLTGGLRWDVFRYAITDRLEPEFTGAQTAAELQPKASVAFRPFSGSPFQTFFNYGRGITSVDARGVIRRPDQPQIATTDFYQFGVQHRLADRLSMMASYFLIHNSNQLVYIPDDGSLELTDPSRSAGVEARASVELTHHLSFNGGITKVFNAYFRDTEPRIYLDSAPYFTTNAALTLSGWRGWSGSLRMRAINDYRLDGQNPSIRGAGHTVFDLAFSRPISHNVELNFAADNLFNRRYWEMQNYFTSQLAGQSPRSRIHGTPSYGRTITIGLTIRFGGK